MKIVDIDESGETFKLNERALARVFEGVPDDMPVSLVSVVGAFRTGKSFLLDFFLKYLYANEGKKPDTNFDDEPDYDWMTKGGELLEGNKNKMKGDKKSNPKGGFGWKHGSDRFTTGIWIWDEWFERRTRKTGEKVAVFVLDTQGMYDSKTGQHLTASIFGLGTLLSSYTIYNLMFQIQEDHLQHLALFSEYGRLASSAAGEDEHGEQIKPFQKLEFLVRDFSKFEDLEDSTIPELHKEMAGYLEDVLSQKFQKDLAEVRDQIELCYEDITCYCLPHPGTDVSEKKSYDGNVKKIRDEFKRLLADFTRGVFAKRIEPKRINGQQVTASQLFQFIKVYVKLFQEAEIFPEAKTLLQATQEANNLSAIVKAVAEYKKIMEASVGPGNAYLPEEKLQKINRNAKDAAMEVFQGVANLGSKDAIAKAEKSLKRELKEAFAVYKETNRLRDPMAFIAPYIIPLTVMVIAYVGRYILETVCPRRNAACWDFADFFGSLYLTIFVGLAVHVAMTGYGVSNRMGGLMRISGK